MKTLIYFLFFSFSFISAVAADEMPIEIVRKTNILMINESFFHQNVEAKLIDARNRKIAEWNFKNADNKNWVINLEELPYGKYTLKVEDDLKIVSIEVSSSKKGTRMHNSTLSKLGKPQIKVEKGLVKFRFFAKGQYTEIKIFDIQGNLIYREDFSNQEVIHRHYRLQNETKNTLKFITKTNGETIVAKVNSFKS